MRGTFASAALLVAAATASGSALAAPPVEFTVAPAIRELSGLAWDAERSVYWSMGDSKSPAELGATSSTTWKTKALPLKDTENKDWEAIVRDSTGALWVLDVGDNDSKRPHVVLYQALPVATATDELTLAKGRVIQVTYPKGPMNVEAGLVRGRWLYLFEKHYTKAAKVVRVDLGADSRDTQVAEAIGKLPRAIGAITDAAVSPEGDTYLLTYGGVYLCKSCESPGGADLEQVLLGFWGQAESLVALANRTFLIGNEEGTVYRVR